MPAPDLKLRVDSYFTDPRLVLCGSVLCVHNKGGGCRYSEVSIGNNGECVEYKLPVEGEDQV